MATTGSRRTLDAINFCVAAVQTGFGPFIAVLLTEHGWSQSDIGFALSVGAVAAMASPLPAGPLIDRVHDKRVPALLAIGAIRGGARGLRLWPRKPPVLADDGLAA